MLNRKNRRLHIKGINTLEIKEKSWISKQIDRFKINRNYKEWLFIYCGKWFESLWASINILPQYANKRSYLYCINLSGFY